MASVRLSVSGMTCNHCKTKVEKALRGLSGVYGVSVDIADGSAEIDFDDSRVGIEDLIMAVRSSGYEAQAA